MKIKTTGKMNNKNWQTILLIGFLIWLVATIIFRLLGQYFFITEDNLILIIPLTRAWQKWRFSAPQTHLWSIKVWFSASTFVVKIAIFANTQTVIPIDKMKFTWSFCATGLSLRCGRDEYA